MMFLTQFPVEHGFAHVKFMVLPEVVSVPEIQINEFVTPMDVIFMILLEVTPMSRVFPMLTHVPDPSIGATMTP